jgi:hypothetical protein
MGRLLAFDDDVLQEKLNRYVEKLQNYQGFGREHTTEFHPKLAIDQGVWTIQQAVAFATIS